MKNKQDYITKIEIKTTISNKEGAENDTVYSNVININPKGLTVLTDFDLYHDKYDKDYAQCFFHKNLNRNMANNFMNVFDRFSFSMMDIYKKLSYSKRENESIHKNQRVKADVIITHTNGVLNMSGQEFADSDKIYKNLSKEGAFNPKLIIIDTRDYAMRIFMHNVFHENYQPFSWLEGETFVVKMPEDLVDERFLPIFINNLKKIAEKSQVILITNMVSDLNLSDVSPVEIQAVKELLNGYEAQSMEFSGEYSSPTKEPLNIHLY